jgi:hypothetical protein
MLESKFAANEGEATPAQLETYQRCSNSLRRLCESLGVNKGRTPRPTMSPMEYAAARRREIEAEAAP